MGRHTVTSCLALLLLCLQRGPTHQAYAIGPSYAGVSQHKRWVVKPVTFLWRLLQQCPARHVHAMP
jgi:hypothetical protein